MDEYDENICGDDGPISAEQCALWLDAKYRRDHELEDRAAAMWLRRLSCHADRDLWKRRYEWLRDNSMAESGVETAEECDALIDRAVAEKWKPPLPSTTP